MRTCTTMIMTDGTNTHYAVMQGPMRGRAFDAHSADIVATYVRTRNTSLSYLEGLTEADQLYRKLTAAHATPKAPAVRWQA